MAVSPKLYVNKPKKAQLKQQQASTPTPDPPSSMAAPPPQPPKESFIRRYKYLWPMLLAVNFSIGGQQRKVGRGGVLKNHPRMSECYMVKNCNISEDDMAVSCEAFVFCSFSGRYLLRYLTYNRKLTKQVVHHVCCHHYGGVDTCGGGSFTLFDSAIITLRARAF